MFEGPPLKGVPSSWDDISILVTAEGTVSQAGELQESEVTPAISTGHTASETSPPTGPQFLVCTDRSLTTPSLRPPPEVQPCLGPGAASSCAPPTGPGVPMGLCSGFCGE